MNQIWQKGHYKIYQVKDGYILHNSAIDGFAHTHIRNFKTAVFIANLSEKKRIPHHLSTYLLVSLFRISDSPEYSNKINELIKNKSKKEYYYNVNKGGRRK